MTYGAALVYYDDTISTSYAAISRFRVSAFSLLFFVCLVFTKKKREIGILSVQCNEIR